MPYPVSLSSILQISAIHTNSGQLCISLFHYKYTTGSPIPDGQAAAVDALNKIRVAGKLVDKYKDCLPDSVNDLVWWAQWVAPTRFRRTTLAIAADAGLVASPTMPSNVSAAITKFAEEASRKGLGTVHMPSVPQSFVNESVLALPGGLAYGALADRIRESITLTGGQILDAVLFHKPDHVMSPKIVATAVQNTTRVARRRTVGLGA